MSTQAAELVLVSGRIHTLDPSLPSVRAVAVRDGRVVAVGTEVDVREWRGADTEVIDLGDAVVTPGLVDGHMHPILGLDTAAGLDLSGVRTLPELENALRGAPRGRDGWVRAWGLDPNVFGARPITSAPLVAAVGDAPAFVMMFDFHAALASPRALEIAGIDGPRTFVQQASVVCDETGRPTGHLLEMEAYELIQAILPRQTAADRRAQLLDVLKRMAAAGLTAGNVMDFAEGSVDLVTSIEADGDLPIKLRFAPMCHPGSTMDLLGHLVAQQRLSGRRWRVDGVKFMIDGTIDGGTAWLEETDVHGESTSSLWPDPEEYANAVRHLSEHGVPTATHAIGDAGVRYVLDALEQTTRTRTPHRIEHVETIPSDLVGRFRALGVVASMQPTHCTRYTRADHTDNWSRRLGDERAARGFRCRDLRDAGALLALGSDWPVAPFDPRTIMADAQLRRPAGRADVEPVGSSQALTARMALEGYTTHAARAAGLTDAGTIAVGQRADFTVFGIDPLTADPDELAGAPVLLTTVDGSVAHCDPGVHR